MFESEDFDLDDDFLKDIGEKEEEYYSQNITPEKPADPPAKRQKVDSLESDLFSDITFDDEPDFAKNTPKPLAKSPKALESKASSESRISESDEISSRKKRILEIFNINSSQPENVSQQKAQFSPPTSVSEKSSSSSLPTENLEASRKKLALEILRKGSTIQTNQNSPPSPNYQQKSLILEKNSENSDYSQKIVKKCHAEVLKKPGERPSRLPGKFTGRNSPKFSSPRTLVRKFPGPAGLLPDAPESNFDHGHFLNGLENCDVDENHEDSKISDFYSQNTERLFSGGAWRSMLDDLPANFLKGHEIATIKRTLRNSRENHRISFVAGVVERIDQSVDNPRLILKDMTDSFEATMHSDIPLTYPNVLEPGVVILLRDAGLLTFQGPKKCPGHQFHIMIGLRNILAVYSEKKRLVSSPWMESMKKSDRTQTDCEDNDVRGENAKNDGSASSVRNPKIFTERNPFSDCKMEISDFEIEDDDMAFACFNLEEINDSQTAASFSKPESKKLAKSSFVKNLKKEEEKKNHVFQADKPEVNQPRKKSPKMIARKSPKNIGTTEKSRSEDSQAIEVEIRPKTITGVRSRLLQFKSNDVLTPPISESKVKEDAPSISPSISKLVEDNQETSDSLMGTFGDDLLASDDDTEDEILSQLDVDSIMTNYNAGS